MKHPFVATVAMFAMTACHKRASLESRLIGTWASPAMEIIYESDPRATPPPLASDFVEITFTPDHKEVWRYRKAEATAAATWRLEGNDLVFTMETEGFYGPPGTTRREKIKSITSDELVFIDGTVEGRWTRVR